MMWKFTTVEILIMVVHQPIIHLQKIINVSALILIKLLHFQNYLFKFLKKHILMINCKSINIELFRYFGYVEFFLRVRQKQASRQPYTAYPVFLRVTKFAKIAKICNNFN